MGKPGSTIGSGSLLGGYARPQGFTLEKRTMLISTIQFEGILTYLSGIGSYVS